MPPIYSKEWNRITIQVRGDHRQGRTSPCEHACLINHKITEKEKRDNLGRRGIYFWQECNFVAEYVIEKEWGAPPF